MTVYSRSWDAATVEAKAAADARIKRRQELQRALYQKPATAKTRRSAPNSHY